CGPKSSMMPIRGTLVACCACAASGHVAAAPPSSVMKSRLLIQSPRQGARAGAVAHRDHRFGGSELVCALLAIDHAHTLLGTACISSASAALKLRSPGAAPL